ncbi:TPA: hypothetical protein ACKP0Y_004325 [Serratia marcescens]
MTELGSADERDNQIAHMPVARLMDEIRGYGQMVGQINQPERAVFLNNMVNPPDKTATREEAKGLRRDLLDVGKARAKALAGATDERAMAEINAQYDQLQTEVLQSYGQPVPQTPGQDPEFAAYAEQYKQQFGEFPDPHKPEDLQGFQLWKSKQQAPVAPGHRPGLPRKRSSLNSPLRLIAIQLNNCVSSAGCRRRIDKHLGKICCMYMQYKLEN